MDQQPSLSPLTQKSPIVRITKPPHDTAAPSSPTPERKLKTKAKMSSLETVLESDSRIHHGLSPDAAPRPVAKTAPLTPHGDKEHQAEKRSQYFHDALYERSGRDSATESVRRETLVYAEVRTNVTASVEDEQHFLITFSHQLAARYNRYPASTVVSLVHSQCLFFGGSSHPAYILTITALPCEIQPATNKRITAVLQKHMEAILRVAPSRGMVRFVPIAEECLAWGSKTVAGRISDAVAKDKEIASGGEGSRAHDRRILKSLSLRRSPANITHPNTQPPTPSKQGQEAAGSSAARKESADKPEEDENIKVVKKKKSLIHTLFRTTKAEDEENSIS